MMEQYYRLVHSCHPNDEKTRQTLCTRVPMFGRWTFGNPWRTELDSVKRRLTATLQLRTWDGLNVDQDVTIDISPARFFRRITISSIQYSLLPDPVQRVLAPHCAPFSVSCEIEETGSNGNIRVRWSDSMSRHPTTWNFLYEWGDETKGIRIDLLDRTQDSLTREQAERLSADMNAKERLSSVDALCTMVIGIPFPRDAGVVQTIVRPFVQAYFSAKAVPEIAHIAHMIQPGVM